MVKSLPLHLNKFGCPSPKDALYQSLVEIGLVVLEKISKCCQCIFTIPQLSPLGERHGLHLNPLYPKMLCAEFG